MYVSYCNKLLFRCKDNIKKTKNRTSPPVYTNLTQNKEEQHNPHISIDTTLQYAIDQNYCVSIELCDSGFYDVQGRVRSLSTEYMTVDCLTDFGLPNGMAHIPLAQITKVRINAVEEQTVNLLYNRESKSANGNL